MALHSWRDHAVEIHPDMIHAAATATAALGSIGYNHDSAFQHKVPHNMPGADTHHELQ